MARRIEQWPGGSTARNHASFRVSTLGVPSRVPYTRPRHCVGARSLAVKAASMILEGDDYLDQLFVWHVDDLLNCCYQNPLHPFTRLRMAHSLRILTLDGSGNRLAFHVQKRRRSRIVVLVADAGVHEEEAQSIPPDVIRFFPPITEQSHPPGMAYRPYKLQEYLNHDGLMILAQRPIKPRAVITFLANKMGGSHLDADRSSEIEYLLNKWSQSMEKGRSTIFSRVVPMTSAVR